MNILNGNENTILIAQVLLLFAIISLLMYWLVSSVF